MAAVSTLPTAGVALAFLAIGMGMLGMGNGSVFQLVPQRFPGSVGILTGVVGAAGGLGGFLLPSLLGTLKDQTGTFGTGFAILAILACTGLFALILLRKPWSRSWPEEAALRAGLLPKADKIVSPYATSV